MFTLFWRALLFWLALFELIASWRGWWGLSWLSRHIPRELRVLLPVTTLLIRRARNRGVVLTTKTPRRQAFVSWCLGGKRSSDVNRDILGRPSWGRWAINLALALLPALLLQIIASSLLNRRLNPLLRLRPGRYDGYTITRFDIPMREGHLPALHVVPQGGAAAAVCVIHGSGCDKTSYAWGLVDTLAERGLALLLIDIDGHGENPRAQSFPAIVEDAEIGVAWLRERYDRVALLGISLGGCIAVRAVADGLAVDGLVVLEAPPLLHYTQADVYREAIALVRPYLLDIFKDCTVEALIKAWEYPPIRAAISTWDLIEALDVRGSLSRIDTPLLLVYGASDAIVKPSQAAQVWAGLPPSAAFHLVPGASHLTLILTPQALRIVGDWLENRLRSAEVDNMLERR